MVTEISSSEFDDTDDLDDASNSPTAISAQTLMYINVHQCAQWTGNRQRTT
jgi:hypothetical protein